MASNRGGTLNGFKLRELFAVPHAADRVFVYAVNFEFGYNSRHWDPKRFTAEMRPIIGLHLGRWDLFANPILDTSFDGFDNMDFAPEERVAYNFSSAWAVAVENYEDLGPIRHFLPSREQADQIFDVVDYSASALELHERPIT